MENKPIKEYPMLNLYLLTALVALKLDARKLLCCIQRKDGARVLFDRNGGTWTVFGTDEVPVLSYDKDEKLFKKVVASIDWMLNIKGMVGMKERFYYFAYGSNMNPLQAHQRVPRARVLGTATLSNWRLVERKTADIEKHRGSTVYGVVYAFGRNEVYAMDRYEGSPKVYCKVMVRVNLDGQTKEVLTYVMTDNTKKERDGKPYADDYRKRCSDGAIYYELPNGFLRTQKVK